ncbi:CRP/FNR family transcriptional regulator, anaerobic regulatory protein [Proteiniborus ethanoligenes]|uniref:CRP/FNR family transcriptional regulator, anaerobic regulatory protein n=1 Tax=Proteiniborus ethanoligenes TaxID=415015 RepID=A0A1H3R0A4_9FIRM|nr:Crp/Fnr family transcriptional regulator [Proteiniborus ethanoligenes]TAH63431.1 MAG: Crp/Fnr family transcriptional regulator [Gottschalkiaceae bacterium]SDZ19252.1 CRP/FNR family transcriptional regulator, anaerobic regulatory protein [Proteiniborus ethanoligenes]
MTVIEYLKKVPIFEGMRYEELEKLERITKERAYKKGSVIIVEGEKGEDVFIIRTGKVKIFKTTNEGREIILDIKGKSKMFAEVTLFSEGKNPATVVAIEDSVILSINNNELEEIIKQNPDMALNIIRVLSKRLKESQSRIKNMASNDTYIRTAQVLIKLTEKYGVELDNGTIELKLNITREELASLAGTSRETVSRALSQFRKEKAIKISGRQILILDKNKLISWYNG